MFCQVKAQFIFIIYHFGNNINYDLFFFTQFFVWNDNPKSNYCLISIRYNIPNEYGSNSENCPALIIEPHELRLDLIAAHVTDPSHSRIKNKAKNKKDFKMIDPKFSLNIVDLFYILT